MHDKNFHSIKSITTPPNWVDNALAVPKTHSKNIVTLPRVLSVAASFALVISLSIPIFLLVKGGNDLPVTFVNPTATSVSETLSGTDVGSHTLAVNTDPTEKAEISEETASPELTDTQGTTDPVEKPTDSGGNMRPEDVDRPNTKPSRPLTKPTESTTSPTNETVAESTGSGNMYPATIISCEGIFPMDFYIPNSDGYTIEDFTVITEFSYYCRIYDSSGNLMGDPNLYSSQHKMSDVIYYKGNLMASYRPKSAGLYLPRGEYTFVFYNESGDDLYTGNLSVN